jgi:hypothetical protein
MLRVLGIEPSCSCCDGEVAPYRRCPWARACSRWSRALLLEAALHGFLLALVVSSGLGHGALLRFVAASRFALGGDHDPFFMPI